MTHNIIIIIIIINRAKPRELNQARSKPDTVDTVSLGAYGLFLTCEQPTAGCGLFKMDGLSGKTFLIPNTH